MTNYFMCPVYTTILVFFPKLLKHEIVFRHRGYVFGAEQLSPKQVNTQVSIWKLTSVQYFSSDTKECRKSSTDSVTNFPK